ncbi:hypothetical protein sr15760 [Sporisorium reilianum SRZ2]|uniref:Uncharacterized protein n=1 Tax=Sporisorium reilianum (strain SRZ2) TaxID=999809 RepID=E6ZRI5_SPORE|nr:hypothetical protein sr15760 [Sporisorium reilianum SRZ2]
MFEVRASSTLFSRDAAADQQAAAAAAAMAAWSAGIAYAINFIVLYLTMSLAVVVVVGAMGCIASPRIRKLPSFIILVFATFLCFCALGINVSMNKELVVNPQKHFNANIYTTLIALSMFIPFIVDFTLILRILAFFPRSSVAASGRGEWKRWAVIAFPTLIKIPRAVLICHYIAFVHSVSLVATDMADVVARVNQRQWALIEWILMLSDELYCTIIFCIKLRQVGWGWGQDKHVSRTFLDTLKKILVSAMACFVVPSFLLIALIVMQALRYRPDLEGYVFATFVPMTVISAAFATLWPAIRAEQHRRKTAGALPPIHTLRNQGQSNKFLTTQRSFDTDDDKEMGTKMFDSSNVELELLEHQPTLKRGQDGPDARSRSTTAESKEGSEGGSMRVTAPHNPLRHAPDVSGIAITTVTEEKWSEA